MTGPDPTASRRLFQHERVAAGYASARPYLHPRILAVVGEVVGPATRFRRAFDVGCGTGWLRQPGPSRLRVVRVAHRAAVRGVPDDRVQRDRGRRVREEEEDIVRAWLESQLAPRFGAAPRPVVFSGYVQALRRAGR